MVLFADLSKHTMQARSKLVPLTKLYQNHEVVYRWGFPAKLIVTWKSKIYTVSKVEAGMPVAEEWGLLPDENQIHPEGSSPTKVDPL